MNDSRAIEAEHRVQPRFRKIGKLAVLGSAVLLFGQWVANMPDREPLEPRTAAVRFEPVALESFAPLKAVGAWRLRSDDKRIGGISALVIDQGQLLALTDDGVVVRLPKPGSGTVAQLRELPAGPGDSGFKKWRDSEALLADPGGRGWWVAFENRNQLWLYDREFRRALRRIGFGKSAWPRNRGIEALASDGVSLLAFPEHGGEVLRVSNGRTMPVAGLGGAISEVVRLPGGELVVVQRSLTPLGFANRLALLERTASGYRASAAVSLGVSAFDNVEAAAAEQLADGRVRLWLMTDDNFKRPLRTLLVALDLPADWPVRRPGRSSSRSRA